MKKKVLQNCGISLKDFRHHLVKNYMYDKEGNPNYEPPSDLYSFIDHDIWKEFIDSRLTDEWKVSFNVY